MRSATLRSGVAAALIAITIAVAVTACGEPSVRGRVTEVRAGDIIEWESIVLRTDDGRDLEFARGAEIDLRFWRASHLREHMTLGLPLSVEYEAVDGVLVATALAD